MDCCIVDIHWLSEAFGGARMGKFDFKPIDGATISDYICIFQERWEILNGLMSEIKKER